MQATKILCREVELLKAVGLIFLIFNVGCKARQYRSTQLNEDQTTAAQADAASSKTSQNIFRIIWD